MNHVGRFAVPLLIGLGSVAGCQQRSRPTVAPSPDPAASPTAAADAEPPPIAELSDADQLGKQQPRTTTPKPELPQPRNDKWATVRKAFDGGLDTSCTTKWVRRNRFEVKTNNVRRLTVDMTKLPVGAPRRGPWIIIIDGQVVEMTGFTPKPGFTGRKRDLIRSKNGSWTFDRRTLYRSGG